jgi:hypothetical protein
VNAEIVPFFGQKEAKNFQHRLQLSTSMSSKPIALLLADLGVAKTHTRPHVSDDNPYSESQFPTMKYRPEFPDRFVPIEVWINKPANSEAKTRFIFCEQLPQSR